MTKVAKEAPGEDAATRIQDLIRPVIESFGAAGGRQPLTASPQYKKYLAAEEELRGFDPVLLESREQRLTFWINIYNVTAIDRKACDIGGAIYSLDDIEYGILRSNARRPYRPWRHLRIWDRRRRLSPDPPEPRVCFALARPGSGLSPRFYECGTMESQLHKAAVDFLSSGGVVIDPEKQTILLAPLLRDCAADFGGGQGLMSFIAAHLESTDDAAFVYSRAGRVDIRFQK